MTKDLTMYSMPNAGCMLGMAYQKLVAQLQTALDDARLDITVPEYLILRTLYERDGLQQCEIADVLGKDKAAVCRCVKTMAARQLVRTEPVSHKCLRIFLAPKGADIRDAIMAVAASRHQDLEHLVTPAELSSFVSVLRKIIDQ